MPSKGYNHQLIKLEAQAGQCSENIARTNRILVVCILTKMISEYFLELKY